MRYKTKKALLRAAFAIVWPLILIAIILAGKAETRCESVQASDRVMNEADRPTEVTADLEPELVEIEVTVIEAQEPVEIEEPTNPEPTYTDEELDALALAIYQEAGSDTCSDETRLMVGTVVLNRVADHRYPDTIQEVLTQRAQYGRLHWTGLVWPERAGYQSEAHAVERAYNLAEDLLSGTVADVLPPDVVFQAEFVQGSEVVAQTDGFYFCK